MTSPPDARASIRLGLFLGGGSPAAWEIARGAREKLAGFPDWDIVRIHGRMLLDPSDLAHGEVDAAILELSTPAILELLDAKRIPAVLVNNLQSPGTYPEVSHDDLGIGAMAAESLWKQGLAHFGFYGLRQYRYAAERWEGFRDWLAVRDCAGRAWRDGGEFLRLVHTRDYLRGLGEWLLTFDGPVGVFAANNMMAVNLIEAAETVGMRVPEDVAVVGVEDLQPNWLPITLSCVRPDRLELGRQAVDLLSRAPDASPTRILVPPLGFYEGQSSALLKPWDRSVRQAVEAIRERIHLPFTVEEIVPLTGTSRRNLERRFRKVLGRSIQEEITRQRLDRARALLDDPDLLIREVAAKVGLKEQRQLNHLFRKKLGLTPGQYRRRPRPRTLG